jgi:hypothetical protein
VLYGGVELWYDNASAVDTSGAFHDIAAVRSNGTTSLYIDGVAVAPSSITGFFSGQPLTDAPNAPGAGIFIGGNVTGTTIVDEARVFTFTGAFNPDDLYANVRVPEPSSIVALLGMCAVGLLIAIRRRRLA